MCTESLVHKKWSTRDCCSPWRTVCGEKSCHFPAYCNMYFLCCLLSFLHTIRADLFIWLVLMELQCLGKYLIHFISSCWVTTRTFQKNWWGFIKVALCLLSIFQKDWPQIRQERVQMSIKAEAPSPLQQGLTSAYTWGFILIHTHACQRHQPAQSKNAGSVCTFLSSHDWRTWDSHMTSRRTEGTANLKPEIAESWPGLPPSGSRYILRLKLTEFPQASSRVSQPPPAPGNTCWACHLARSQRHQSPRSWREAPSTVAPNFKERKKLSLTAIRDKLPGTTEATLSWNTEGMWRRENREESLGSGQSLLHSLISWTFSQRDAGILSPDSTRISE